MDKNKNKEWVIETDGTNMFEVFQQEEIDFTFALLTVPALLLDLIRYFYEENEETKNIDFYLLIVEDSIEVIQCTLFSIVYGAQKGNWKILKEFICCSNREKLKDSEHYDMVNIINN